MPISWRFGNSTTIPQVAAANRFGNFQGMTDSVPYLKDLGITAVWMTPIFPSPAYHGYQHAEADRVNPWFGEEREFWTFVNTARAADIKVYIDFVVYGINQESGVYQSALRDPHGPFEHYFAWADEAAHKPFGYNFRTWNGDPVRFVNWDLRSEGPRDLVTSWARHWLDPNADGDPSDGIAGFRLDHVWSTYKPDKPAPSGWGYNIDPFWLDWKKSLVALKPDVFTFAEQAKWETWGVDLLPAHDATFTKPFEFAAREALRTETAAKLYEWMGKAVDAIPANRTFLTILGDHDVDRIASAIGADTAEHRGRARAAAAVLILQPFPPVLYYGDEIEMLGKAGKFGSDSNDIPRREPMKWLSVEGAPMTHYHALDPRTVAKQYSRDNDGRSVQEQAGIKDSALDTYRTLITLRKDNIALRRGRYEAIPCENPAVWRFRRVHPEQVIEVAINLSGTEVKADPASGLAAPLAPYGFSITKLER